MDFWSKGLGKRTVAIGLARSEPLLSERALCLKGTMDEPVSWDYVMLLETSDLIDFFALLKDPGVARYIHASPNRWRLYARFVAGALQITWLAIVAAIRSRSSNATALERVAIELPPPSMVRKRKRKRPAYRRRLSTTTLAAPTMGGQHSTDSVAALDAWSA